MDVDGVLRGIHRIIADDDWDGISAAIQVRAHYPGTTLEINSDKVITKSDTQTLVLDKTTIGDGWVIDHHPRARRPKNVLAFSEDGMTPTSTLTYNILPEKSEKDLLLSATAEITEGLDQHGLRYGSLGLLLQRFPHYTAATKTDTQFGVRMQIYLLADILAFLSAISPEEALKAGNKMSVQTTVPADISSLTVPYKEHIFAYLSYIDSFSGDGFSQIEVGNHPVSIGSQTDFDYPLPALSKATVLRPGNYVMYRGDRLSLRVADPRSDFLDTVAERLDGFTKDMGGRASWFGITLHTFTPYEHLVDCLRNKPQKKIHT